MSVDDLECAARAGETARIHQILRELGIGYVNAFLKDSESELVHGPNDSTAYPQPSKNLATAGGL